MRRRVQRLLAIAITIAAATSLVLAATPPTNGPALTAGEESTVALPASGAMMKIYLPSNYDTTRKWPALFYYHGMGEHPETTVMRRFTDGRDYIVVALPYVTTGDQPRTAQDQAASQQSERASFHAARTWLVAHASVDEARLFMAGASKGGWTTSTLGEMELPGLAGLIILLAGRQSGHALVAATVKDKPIYIGAGETDPNLIAARRAREVYKRAGAIVSFEEFTGHGHEIPPDAPTLRAWLHVQGRYHPGATNQAPQQEATAELTALFKAAEAETNALSQYSLLRALAEDPRLRLCDPAIRQQMGARFTSLVQTSPAREEWSAESTFNELLYREANIQKLTDMKAVVDGFQSLVQSYPQTRYGKLGAQYLPHLAEAYQKSLEATRSANEGHPHAPQRTVAPSFPSSGSSHDSIPIPVRRGNKITFEQPGAK